MRVLVVDYGTGNHGSVVRSFEECGARVLVSNNPQSISGADRIVIPGVGAFGDAMDTLRRTGWRDALHRASLEDQIPILGICLGMQLLADYGDEGGGTDGLGLIGGRACRLNNAQGERLPHVGWNEVHSTSDSALFRHIAPGTDFYFVHSYHLAADDAANVIATTPYCGVFGSAVARDNIFGVQFHPEKSSKAGLQLIRNFLSVSRRDP
jgi:glutamine amidotransferase